MSITGFIKRHPVSSFFALAFAYSWIWWGILFVIAPKGFEAGRAEMGALALYGLFGAAVLVLRALSQLVSLMEEMVSERFSLD